MQVFFAEYAPSVGYKFVLDTSANYIDDEFIGSNVVGTTLALNYSNDVVVQGLMNGDNSPVTGCASTYSAPCIIITPTSAMSLSMASAANVSSGTPPNPTFYISEPGQIAAFGIAFGQISQAVNSLALQGFLRLSGTVFIWR
jgi:hypothetical protein